MTTIVTRDTTQADVTANSGGTTLKATALTHAELDKNFFPLCIATNGAVEANKAVVVDGSLNVTGLNNVTMTGALSAATVAGAMVDTTVSAATTKVPHSSAVQTYVAANSANVTLDTVVATTTGDNIVLTSSLPAGCTRIELIFDSVSQNTTDEMILQIGTTGPIWTVSGYASGACFPSDAMASSNTQSTAGFILTAVDAAARVYSGIVNLRLINGVWVYESHLHGNGASQAVSQLGGGRVADPTNITHIRLNTTSAGTFDGGQVQVAYWT